MVRYSNGTDRKDVCHETHALIFLTKLNMIRNVFNFLKGCVFKYFLWILYSNVVVLVKYNQFKKEKKGKRGDTKGWN